MPALQILASISIDLKDNPERAEVSGGEQHRMTPESIRTLNTDWIVETHVAEWTNV